MSATPKWVWREIGLWADGQFRFVPNIYDAVLTQIKAGEAIKAPECDQGAALTDKNSMGGIDA